MFNNPTKISISISTNPHRYKAIQFLPVKSEGTLSERGEFVSNYILALLHYFFIYLIVNRRPESILRVPITLNCTPTHRKLLRLGRRVQVKVTEQPDQS